HANVIPSEVGWQFVPQYYTFVNKQPHRLHCFYTKNSTFIHGTEGEDGRPCYGQQEIHNKILSIGFQDCKVFIHSVDAQSSANGGIIIQVIGEMSNKGEPWRKFAQTFFLAEQPNGYFVLNDIFRFLKEESVDPEDEEAENAESAVPPTEVAQENTLEPAAPAVQAVHPTVAAQPFEAVLPNHLQSKPIPEVIAEPEVVVMEEKKTVPNGIHTPTSVVEPELPPASAPQAEPVKQAPAETAAPTPVTEAPQPVTPKVATPRAPSPTPAQAPAPVATLVAAPAAAPAAAQPAAALNAKPTPTAAPVQPAKPAAPPVPKTWANLAAANSNKWGPQVAQEARGVSAAPPPAPAPVPAPPGLKSEPRVEKELRDGGRESHPAYQAALSVSSPQCFVKGVTEVVSHQALSHILTSRFGNIKDLDIVRNKACAFLEFASPEGARRAIIASLPVSAGGEGGLRMELEGGANMRITVETRKERGDRPPPRPRTGGGPATGGQERGGGPGAGGGTSGG
ncbi:hypothetical protein BU17DRAFT_19849, partial [Hysterangium stoloniferum]